MKVTEVKDISSLEDGELVMRVEGEIARVYEMKSGEKESKPWSIQNFYLKDETGEVRVAAWNHDDLQPLVHKKVSITAHKSDKGFTGVYAEHNDYKGKVTKQLRLTATAQIERLDDRITQKDADYSNVQAPSARPNPQRISTPPPEQQNASTGFDDMLQRICNAQYLIKREVKRQWEQATVDGILPEQPLTGSPHFQADCSSAFIKLDRAGEVEKLSTAPIWREAKQPALSEGGGF